MVESNFNNLISFLYHMSGDEKTSYSGIEQEPEIERPHESTEMWAEEGLGRIRESGSAAEREEERETHIEKFPEHETKEEKQPHKKKRVKSRRKGQEFSLTNIGKQLEKKQIILQDWNKSFNRYESWQKAQRCNQNW